MGQVKGDISISLDGYVAGPQPSEQQPLGAGGEQLHEWAIPLASWRRLHGREGGETGPDDDIVAEQFDSVGAVVMGRGMFGGGPGPWREPAWEGWWGEEPPFRMPVFVLTHHPRKPLVKSGGTTFTFVGDVGAAGDGGATSGGAVGRGDTAGGGDAAGAGGADDRGAAAGAGGAIEAAVAQARAAAGDRDVLVAGGASAIDQALAAGLVDRLQLHVVPVLLGGGVRLFAQAGDPPPRLQLERTVASPRVTHLSCRVLH